MSERRILAEFSNGLGNFLMLTPALRALRVAFPGRALDLVVAVNPKEAKRWETIVELCRAYEGGLLDRVLVEDQAARFDSSAWERVFVPFHGEPCKLRDGLLAQGATTNRHPEWWRMHEVEHGMELAYAAGYVGPVPPMEAPARDLTRENGVTWPETLVCNSSNPGPLYVRKRWPAERWVDLVSILRSWRGDDARVGCVGGSGDLAGDGATEDLTGGGIVKTIEALRHAKLLVTSDTFAMHLAAALRVPIVALFGPTSASKNRPWTTSPVEIVRPATACAPCQFGMRFPSCTDARCMREIGVGEVMRAVRAVERRVARQGVEA